MNILRYPAAWIAIPSIGLLTYIAVTVTTISNTPKTIDDYQYLPAAGEVILRESFSGRTVIFIGSFTCSHCKNFYENTFQRILKEVDANVIYRHAWPTSLTQRSAALLTSCSGKGNAAGVIKTFYEHQKELIQAESIDALYELAGIPEDARQSVEECAEALDKRMMEHQERDAERFDIQGTPTIVFDGKAFTGNKPFEDFGFHEE